VDIWVKVDDQARAGVEFADPESGGKSSLGALPKDDDAEEEEDRPRGGTKKKASARR